ncbi:hypothetical protein Slin14017_G120820 [Septoria linicola]|nr:hypothetical protein Slin14017_G120820 [Septoria linicola]
MESNRVFAHQGRGHTANRTRFTRSSSKAAPAYDDTQSWLVPAVQFFSIQQCGVLHDNVYALLGIAYCAILPDYDMPIMDLYTSALYNYLLSLWAMRPPDDGISYETLRDWDMLEKLGLDYSKLQALGETFMHAFQIKPFHELVFLVTYHVCRQFSAEAALLMVQGLASNWLFHTEYTKLETGSAEDLVKRKWYESEDRAVKRFNKDLMARTDSAMKLLEKVQRANRMLAAPLWESPAKALVSDGRSKPCLDWITSTDAICDEILTRWTARLH